MRIAHVVSRLDPSDGGPPAVVARLASAQVRAGHDVTVSASEPRDSAAEFQRAYGKIDGYAGIGLDFFPARTMADRLLATAAQRQLERTLADADFVHIHGMWQPPLLHAATICRSRRTPYCVTPHGMLSRWTMSQKSLKKHLALAIAWRSALNKANFVQFLNAGEREQSRDLGLFAPDVIVPNGVEPEELALDASVPLRLPPLPERFVLFVGRLHESKGLDILCDAFARVARRYPDVGLVVVGPDFGYREALVRRVQELELGHRVQLLGAVYGQEKVALLHRCEVLCLPSRQEGFSVTVLEALACGAPVVISDACNFDDVEPAGAGFVTPLDSNRVSAALDRVCAEPAPRIRWGAAALRLVSQRFTWTSLASEIVGHYMAHLAPESRMFAPAMPAGGLGPAIRVPHG